MLPLLCQRNSVLDRRTLCHVGFCCEEVKVGLESRQGEERRSSTEEGGRDGGDQRDAKGERRSRGPLSRLWKSSTAL